MVRDHREDIHGQDKFGKLRCATGSNSNTLELEIRASALRQIESHFVSLDELTKGKDYASE